MELVGGRSLILTLWGKAGVTRSQHTAQKRNRTQIQYLNTDISEDPEHGFSIRKKEFNVSKINPPRSEVEKTFTTINLKIQISGDIDLSCQSQRI